MSTQTFSDVPAGKTIEVHNRQPRALSVDVTALADGTVFRMVLIPGASASITKGAGQLSVTLDSTDDDAAGMLRVV